MHPALDHVSEQLDHLVRALDGHHAGAIISATENLAAAVVLLDDAYIPADQAEKAGLLIGATLEKMDAAAIRINMLKAWTRQRIDRNHQIRGIHQRGMALSY